MRLCISSMVQGLVVMQINYHQSIKYCPFPLRQAKYTFFLCGLKTKTSRQCMPIAL